VSGGEHREPRPRVFVSSVVDGFAEFRRAAREGITAAGGEAVLVNEDFPSVAASSRNACLDAISSCDYFVTVLGERGGWEAPSGRLVIEEEYEHARLRGIPRLLFLQETARDPAATRVAMELSDYVDGTFRRTFKRPADLCREIERSLRPLFDGGRASAMTAPLLNDYFRSPYRRHGTPMLRLALSSERQEEFIDPVRLHSTSLLHEVYELAHRADIGLFDYAAAKRPAASDTSLVILQQPESQSHGGEAHVRLELTEGGAIIIDNNVSGRNPRLARSTLDTMVVAIEDIERVLVTAFAFAAAFYDLIDTFKRHQRFGYKVGLTGLDYRTLERNPRERTSYAMSLRSTSTSIVAFDQPRMIDRQVLSAPKSEVDRVVVLLEQHAKG
jgi:hypothetical protein